jgi:hypothetical protein
MKTENEKELNELIMECRKNVNYIVTKTYYNSVKIYFNKVITTDIFEQLNKLNFNYFVTLVDNNIYENGAIYLFIYKKKYYDFN